MHNGYPRGGHRKEARCLVAEDIAKERAERTPEQQLALIKTRRGESKRETARLLKQIDERKNPKAKKTGETPGRERAIRQSRA